MLKYTKSIYPELSGIKFEAIFHEDLTAKLIEIEHKSIQKKYKFGLLYVKEGQTNEDEMFSNTQTSPEFEEFVEFLGKK
jgi:hypothetical protein